jgi:predicted  nucleic acid-binding Zn-ribbon protein
MQDPVTTHDDGPMQGSQLWIENVEAELTALREQLAAVTKERDDYFDQWNDGKQAVVVAEDRAEAAETALAAVEGKAALGELAIAYVQAEKELTAGVDKSAPLNAPLAAITAFQKLRDAVDDALSPERSPDA